MKKLSTLYLGTNTKMYKTIADTKLFLETLHDLTSDLATAPLKLFTIPSFTTLETAGKLLENSHIQLGAQNMCWEDEGQFTGEISPLMLKEVGVNIVEIGHSERRHTFRENNFEEEKKVKAALKHQMTPLLCIGETESDKNYHIGDEVLAIQLKIALSNLTASEALKVLIAYEPVWAIGINGKPPTPEYVAKKHRYLRSVLIDMFGKEIGSQIPLLYGGSVNLENAPWLIQLEDIDGLFIGRSAWDAHNFNQIIRTVLPLYENK